MNIDLTVKVIAAVAGLVCGLTQTYANGKTLYKMAKTGETGESAEDNDSQMEEV